MKQTKGYQIILCALLTLALTVSAAACRQRPDTDTDTTTAATVTTAHGTQTETAGTQTDPPEATEPTATTQSTDTSEPGTVTTTEKTPDVTEPPSTETTTTTTATTTTEPAVTEPPAPAVADAAEALAALEAQMSLFFAEGGEEQGDAVQLMEQLLPYIMGNGTFSLGDSYHLSNFTSSGERAFPMSVISHDGVTVNETLLPSGETYRQIEIERDRGRVGLLSLGDECMVDDLELYEADEEDDDVFTVYTPKQEALITETQAGCWTLSESYILRLLGGVLGKGAPTEDFAGKLSGTLDATALHTDGELRLSAYAEDGTAQRMGAELRFLALDTAMPRMEMTVEQADGKVIELSAMARGGVMSAMRVSHTIGETETVIEQVVDGMHTDISLRMLTSRVMVMEMIMSADITAEQSYRGTVRMTVDPEGISHAQTDIVPLSTTTDSTTTTVQGEFSVVMADGEIDMLEMVTQTTAGTVTGEVETLLRYTDAKAGEAVIRYVTDIQNSADPSGDVRTEIEIRLLEGTPTQGKLMLGCEITSAAGTEHITADITTPAAGTLTFSAHESELMARAERVFAHADDYVAQAEQAVQWVVEGIRGNRFIILPETFYLKDSDGDGIVFLVGVSYDEGYYVRADILLDVERYTYFYHGYDELYDMFAPAGLIVDRNRLADAMSAHDDTLYFAERSGNAIGYFYQPQQGLYVLYDAASGKYGYVWDEPTAEDFPGRVLHKVTFDENGAIVGDIHELEVTYDEDCIATHTCRACGFKLISREPMHDYATDRVICEQSGTQPRTVLSFCTQCGDGAILLTDGEGHTLRMLFEKASYATIAMENTHRPDHTSWERIGAGRDLTNCVIITEIIAEYDRSQVFGCDLVIPDLRPAAGLTVLGIRFDDFTYQITDTPNLTVVFPEGMEFIGCHGSPLFSQVIAVTLPETLRYISEGGMSGYQGETLVLPAALEYWSDVGFHLDKLKSLTIKGAHYESTPSLWCPNLEELNLLGTYDIFRGFDTPCKIEEFVVPNGVTMIADRTFENMTSLKKVVIPEGVTEIGRYAFRGCENLTEVILPASVTKIGEAVFDGCTSLVSVNLGGLTEIPNSMFAGCSALETVTVSGNLTSIGYSAFQYCNALKDIDLSLVTSIGDSAFWSCSSLTQIDISRLTAIPNNAFRACTSLHTVKVGEGLVSIGQNAFKSCGKLRNIDLPANVEVGHDAFAGCELLP